VTRAAIAASASPPVTTPRIQGRADLRAETGSATDGEPGASAISMRASAMSCRRSFGSFRKHRWSRSLTLIGVTVKGGDVRVAQRGQHLRLALKASQSFWIVGKLVGQDLDGDVTRQVRVLGAVDLSHPACADLFRDVVVRERGADHRKFSMSMTCWR